MGRILLVALLLIASSAAAQPTEPGIQNPDESTPTTLYMHINGFQDFPINTQKPDDRYAATPSRGASENSGCVVDPVGAQHFTDKSAHTWYGYSSPSIVEYDVDQGGEPRIHQERGLTYDVELDTSADATFTWFLKGVNPAPVEPGADPDQAPGPIPDAVVRATVREGDDISVGDAAFNQGTVIAIGESQPTTLAGALTQENEHVSVHEVDGEYVYQFTFPLEFQESVISREEGFNIRVDAFVDNPYCDDPGADGSDYFFVDHARVHTSSEFRPNLAWSIMNPLIIEMMHPQFVGDDLVVHTQINSPWGSYDVLGDLAREQPLGFEFDGPSTALSVERILVDHTRGHGPEYHFKPVQATWLWDYRADQAKDGIYTVTLHAQNDQQTAEAWAVSTFELGNTQTCYEDMTGQVVCESGDPDPRDRDTPGLPVAALVGLLAALGLLARRR